jgi:plasmid maintenance system killer protein
MQDLASKAELYIVKALKLAFATKQLRQLCEKEVIAQRELGVTVAEKLKRRLADMRAATCVKDLIAGGPRALTGPLRGHVSLSLGRGFRLIFCANHNTLPVLKSGEIDWSEVRRIQIQEIKRDDD